MKLPNAAILFLLIFISSLAYPQYYDKLKESADNYLISLSANSSDQKEFKNLKEILFTHIDKAVLTKIYQTTEKELDSLKNHFTGYESMQENISKDSAFVLFNQWYLHFSNTFYNYAEEKFFSSDKVKLLLFSASVSCACTLELCRKQTAGLINFAKQNGYEFWIVDSYENNQLQIEYETLFTPSVIVFDGNNKVLHKIEYDENMISQLDNYLKK
ncbi:Hypothetical protein IALB_2842 [Ignavibacterium album JCM 16511]|uniref:Thioredoxin domain-containing protein n=1 Tax=Ignavibacterium album (strain DSM 19864 / JCM 16511 / NBRC 101810 / Mat9-16) TaxID=945713 RepID=I0ANI8_IGNAJ|nr:hypothetical protein [Ignavibacterium album]AFH50545.1 Hypothetical protein IALB_2842 [Ignavibacterium album JCM 16511]